MKTSPLQFTSLSIKLSSTVPQLIYRIKRCPPPTRQSVRNVGHILLAAQNQKSGQMAAIEFFFFRYAKMLAWISKMHVIINAHFCIYNNEKTRYQ